MTSLLTILILVSLSFLGSYIFSKLKSDNAFINSAAYTGIFYILMGVILGPHAADIINQLIMNELSILYSLVLGWAGFLIGLQTNLKGLRRFSRQFYLYSASNILVVILVTFFLFIAVNNYFNWNYGILSLFILTISGAVTSPILFGYFVRDYRVFPESSYLLQFNSAFDNIIGVILFGIILAAGNIVSNAGQAGIELLFAFGISIIAIAVYYYLSKEFKNEEEKFLLLIGLLLIVDGAALYFNQSVIFMSYIFGFGLANAHIKTRGLLRDINQLEKPMYILLLIFVGANLTYSSPMYFAVFLFFFLIHLAGKLFSGWLTNHALPEKLRLGPLMGMGNLGLGGLSLAMILDFHLIKQSAETSIFLFAIVITLFIQDTMSWYYLRKVLVKNPRKVKR